MGVHPNMREIYNDTLRESLLPTSRAMWDSRLHWWNGKGWRNSFYYYGLSGLFAGRSPRSSMPGRTYGVPCSNSWTLKTLMSNKKYFMTKWQRIFPRSMKWVLGRKMTMNLLGVPREQGLEVKASHSGGIAGFIESCIEAVCCQLPFRDNYFCGEFI